MDEILQAMNHLSATGDFFRHLADTFLFITFVELANGFRLCVQVPGEPSKMRKFSRIAAFVWGFVLVAVALGLFGAANAHWVRVREVENSSTRLRVNEGEKLARNFDHLIQLEGALTILFWLTTIPAIVLASFAQHKAKLNGILSSVSLSSPLLSKTNPPAYFITKADTTNRLPPFSSSPPSSPSFASSPTWPSTST
jgi:hypothetical protein